MSYIPASYMMHMRDLLTIAKFLVWTLQVHDPLCCIILQQGARPDRLL